MRPSRWWLAMLLRLYPPDFRERRSGEIRDYVEEELAATHRPRAIAVLGITADLLYAALRLRFGRRRRVEIGGASAWWRDVGEALRAVTRRRGLSFAVIVTLGVGIGANVALFTLVRSVLLEPLPYPDAQRLVRLWETNPTAAEGRTGPSPLNFVDWERNAEGFASMTSWYLTSATYRGAFGAEEIPTAQVSKGFFDVLGVPPAIGRTFQREDGPELGPVMLSHRAWLRLFAGDEGVVGATVDIAGEPREIVGVMPADFSFPNEEVEAWLAWDLEAAYADRPETRTWRFMDGLGRLVDDVDIRAAERDLREVAAALASAHPGENGGWSVTLTPLHQEVVGEAASTLWVAFGAAIFVLLVACANVGNLMLARVPTVARDVSLRMALGATRGAIARRLLLESLVLAGVASGLGLLIGRAFLDLLVRLDAGGIPRLSEVVIDGTVLGFAVVVAGLTAVIFGLAPALEALRGASHRALRSGGRSTGDAGARSLREVFVASQLAVAVVLLSGAQLFSSSLRELTRVDLGFDPAEVITFRVSLDPMETGAAGIVAYYDELVSDLASLPRVRAVGLAQTLPMNPVGNDFRRPFRPEGSDLAAADAPLAQMRIVSPDYIQAMGIRMLEGVPLPGDAALGEPLVAVVNETLANRLRSSGTAVGGRMEIDFRDGWESYAIVGVAQDVRHYGPRAASVPEVFLSHRQIPYLAMSAVVRSESDAEGMAQALRDAVAALQPSQPAYAFVTMEALTTNATADERFLAVLLAISSAIVLLLVTTGIYGVMAYVVSRRRREMGIRLALGADPHGVVRTVLGRALLTAGAGILAGMSVAFAGGSMVESLLYGVEPRDPAGTAGVLVLLLAVSAVAAYLPARRAGQIPPSEALQSE